MTTGSQAAAQQDCISGLPQQVYAPVPCSDVPTGVYACSTLASTFVKNVLLFLRFPVISPCQSGKNLHAFKLDCGLFVQFLDLQNTISYEILKRKWSAWSQALLSGPWILFQFESLQDNMQASLHFFQDHVSRKGKPSAKAHKDSDPQSAGKGSWEIKSADFKSSPSKLLSEHEFETDGVIVQILQRCVVSSL